METTDSLAERLKAFPAGTPIMFIHPERGLVALEDVVEDDDPENPTQRVVVLS